MLFLILGLIFNLIPLVSLLIFSVVAIRTEIEDHRKLKKEAQAENLKLKSANRK